MKKAKKIIKNKKIFSIVLMIILILNSLAPIIHINAEETELEYELEYEGVYWEYDEIDGEIHNLRPVRDADRSGDLKGFPYTIKTPKTIDGKPIKSIADNAFKDLNNIYGGTYISEGIEIIGNNAFEGFVGDLVLPSTLTTIGSYAFKNSNIYDFTIPENVSIIGTDAFLGVSNYISAKINSYANYYLAREGLNYALYSNDENPHNPWPEDGKSIEADGYEYEYTYHNENLIIQDGRYPKLVEGVNIPDVIVDFANTKGWEITGSYNTHTNSNTFNIPSKIDNKTVLRYRFSNDTFILLYYEDPENPFKISKRLVVDLYEKIYIPPTLLELEIWDNVYNTILGEEAKYYVYDGSVNIINYLQSNGFNYEVLSADKKTSDYLGVNYTYDLIEGRAYNLKPTNKGSLPTILSVPKYIDGYEVYNIADNAFENSSNLKEIIIEGIPVINSRAFNQCINLETVNILSGTHTILDNAFTDCPNLYYITIPNTLSSLMTSDYYASSIYDGGITNIQGNAYDYINSNTHITHSTEPLNIETYVGGNAVSNTPTEPNPTTLSYEIHYFFDDIEDIDLLETGEGTNGELLNITDYTNYNSLNYILDTEMSDNPIISDTGSNIFLIFYNLNDEIGKNTSVTFKLYIDGEFQSEITERDYYDFKTSTFKDYKVGQEINNYVLSHTFDPSLYIFDRVETLPCILKADENIVSIYYLTEEPDEGPEEPGPEEPTPTPTPTPEEPGTEDPTPEEPIEEPIEEPTPTPTPEPELPPVEEPTPEKLNYTINNYFDNILDETKTVSGSAIEGTIIKATNYSNDIYEIDTTKTTNLDFVLTQDNQTFEVYYKTKTVEKPIEEPTPTPEPELPTKPTKPERTSFNVTYLYYYNNIVDAESFEWINVNKGTLVASYIDKKPENYELDRIDKLPITVYRDEIVNIYYKEIKTSYTIETYKDDLLINTKNIDNQKIGTIIDNIETEDIEGYNVNIENLPLTLVKDASQNVIKIKYEIPETSYTVISYYENNDKITETYTIDKLKVGTTINEIALIEKEGYELDRIETLPFVLKESENIITVFYKSIPVIEEPTPEEPKPEEPKPEVKEEPKPTPTPTPTPEEPKKPNVPKVEEPVIEEPEVKEPVVEEPIIEEPVLEEPEVDEEPIIEEPIIEEEHIIEEKPVIEELPEPSKNIKKTIIVVSIAGLSVGIPVGLYLLFKRKFFMPLIPTEKKLTKLDGAWVLEKMDCSYTDRNGNKVVAILDEETNKLKWYDKEGNMFDVLSNNEYLEKYNNGIITFNEFKELISNSPILTLINENCNVQMHVVSLISSELDEDIKEMKINQEKIVNVLNAKNEDKDISPSKVFININDHKNDMITLEINFK